MADATVTFFYDFSSPYSYLGATQIQTLCDRHNATLVWHPMLLGAVFKSIGAPIVPMFEHSEMKRRNFQVDMVRYASYYDVPFSFPTRFPMKTVSALRLALAASEIDSASGASLSHRIFRAYWAEDRDINDPAVLTECVQDCNLDPNQLSARIREPDLKKRLFENTQTAVDAGVFGAPSYLVSRSGRPDELLWGQDRSPLLEWMLDKEITETTA